jgi:triacylglycerol lipase
MLLCMAFLASGTTCTYVLHGFAGHKVFMSGIARYLKSNGCVVKNWDYPSMRDSIPAIARELRTFIACHHSCDTVNFVSHSMGGVVVRAYCQLIDGDSSAPYVGRVVMIMPPNKGSSWADFWSKATALHWLMGPNIANLRTDSSSLANRLPYPDKEKLGIIVGGKFDGKGVMPLLFKGDNDGVVGVEQTNMTVASDYVMLPVPHNNAYFNRQIREYALLFLHTGYFIDRTRADSAAVR